MIDSFHQSPAGGSASPPLLGRLLAGTPRVAYAEPGLFTKPFLKSYAYFVLSACSLQASLSILFFNSPLNVLSVQYVHYAVE